MSVALLVLTWLAIVFLIYDLTRIIRNDRKAKAEVSDPDEDMHCA